jgi:signal transduction histidine kinase
VALVYVASVSPSVVSVTLNMQTVGMILVLSYYLYVVGYVAVVRTREGAFLNMFGLMFVCVAIVHDYYLYVKRIDSVQIVPYGLLIILLVQAQIISYRYARFQQRSMQLAHELQQANRHLEEKVAERTRELHASNVRLTDLANQRSRLMANIAHDMGSPLSGVQSSLHLLGENTLNPQIQHDLFALLISRVDHVKRLVDDLFQLAKLESRQWEFEWEEVPADVLYAEMHRYFAQMLQEQGRDLTQMCAEPTGAYAHAVVRVDRGQMYRVVQNLLDNAVKFSTDPRQPIEFTSTVRSVHDAGGLREEWHVEIVDFGVGIASTHLPMIFERFYTRSSGLPVGSGLGLAISKEIIERHGGTIEVSSSEGHGSTFSFTVPIMR